MRSTYIQLTYTQTLYNYEVGSDSAVYHSWLRRSGRLKFYILLSSYLLIRLSSHQLNHFITLQIWLDDNASVDFHKWQCPINVFVTLDCRLGTAMSATLRKRGASVLNANIQGSCTGNAPYGGHGHWWSFVYTLICSAAAPSSSISAYRCVKYLYYWDILIHYLAPWTWSPVSYIYIHILLYLYEHTNLLSVRGSDILLFGTSWQWD